MFLEWEKQERLEVLDSFLAQDNLRDLQPDKHNWHGFEVIGPEQLRGQTVHLHEIYRLRCSLLNAGRYIQISCHKEQ